MRHCLSIAVAVWVVFSVSSACAEDIASKILKYFPGKWEAQSDNGGYTGTVQWRKVAGGKAIAGPGTSKEGVKSFAIAGWDSSKKCWVHSGYMSDRASIHIEISKFENDTYIGKGSIVDANGVALTGTWRNRVIDQDHFEVTTETDDGPIVSKWRRVAD